MVADDDDDDVLYLIAFNKCCNTDSNSSRSLAKHVVYAVVVQPVTAVTMDDCAVVTIVGEMHSFGFIRNNNCLKNGVFEVPLSTSSSLSVIRISAEEDKSSESTCCK